MKKITLSLLALSTIVSADSLTLNCSFPGHEDGTIKIYLPPDKAFDYRGPGYCSSRTNGAFIGDDSIIIIGDNCSIDVRRATGAVSVKEFRNGTVEYKGTCAKQSNAI